MSFVRNLTSFLELGVAIEGGWGVIFPKRTYANSRKFSVEGEKELVTKPLFE